jgi:hypothetical protein
MVGIIREIVSFQARREGKYSSPTPPACLGKLIPVGRKEDYPSVELMSGNLPGSSADSWEHANRLLCHLAVDHS